MSHSAVIWEMLEVLQGWSRNRAAPLQRSRCAAHTRSWSRKFMICSYWGIHTFISREVFHILVWCSSSQSNRRSQPVCFLSMERQCVPRRSCGAVNQSLSLWEEPSTELKFIRFALTTNTLYISPDNSLFGWICKSETVMQCVRRSMRKYSLKSW